VNGSSSVDVDCESFCGLPQSETSEGIIFCYCTISVPTSRIPCQLKKGLLALVHWALNAAAAHVAGAFPLGVDRSCQTITSRLGQSTSTLRSCGTKRGFYVVQSETVRTIPFLRSNSSYERSTVRTIPFPPLDPRPRKTFELRSIRLGRKTHEAKDDSTGGRGPSHTKFHFYVHVVE
jgi:hypothetical protein